MQPQPPQTNEPLPLADQPQALPAMPSQPPIASAPIGVPNAAGSQPAGDTSSNPELADDGDLIEKDWVAKVQQILASTAHDPFEQTKQFSQLKADYMQKRYGKLIKSGD